MYLFEACRYKGLSRIYGTTSPNYKLNRRTAALCASLLIAPASL